MIEFECVSVALGGRTLFRDMNWHLTGGEILAILRRNGRGKTTLIRAFLGLQGTEKGRIHVRGSLGYMPQRTSTPFNFSVLEVVLTGRARRLGLFESPGSADRKKAPRAGGAGHRGFRGSPHRGP